MLIKFILKFLADFLVPRIEYKIVNDENMKRNEKVTEMSKVDVFFVRLDLFSTVLFPKLVSFTKKDSIFS